MSQVTRQDLGQR